MNPGGGSGWDEPPLDIQIPDDARELDRDVLAYHRELRARRRRNRLRRLGGPFAAGGAVMPLLASILAVCLVAGAMLSVATFSPATSPAERTPRPTTAASTVRPAPATTSHATAPASHATAATTATTATSHASPATSRSGAATSPSGTRGASRPASPPASAGRPGASASGSPGAPR